MLVVFQLWLARVRTPLHYFGVHQGCVGFCIGECDRSGWWDVEEEVLKKWAKAPEGVNRQRDQYHVLDEDIANYK